MARQGTWEQSLSFALGNFYGQEAQSVRVPLSRVNVVPILSEFATSGVDPAGSRHLTTHASFVGTLASGRGPASFAFDEIDMQSVNIGAGSGISCTKVFLFRINQFDCPAESRVYNMKTWASSVTDFLTSDTHKVVFETHQTWQGDVKFPTNYMIDSTKFLPVTQPDQFNLRRQDGGVTIHGSGDADVSEWIYVAVAASGTLPLGQYGLTSASGFMLRVTYDIDNIHSLRD